MKSLLIVFFISLIYTSSSFSQIENANNDKYKEAYEYVISHQSIDPYFVASRAKVVSLLDKISRTFPLPEFELIIAKIPSSLKGDLGVFYTSACSSVFPRNMKPVILCSENYLYEIEAGVRANEMASVYNTKPFYSDKAIYDFIRIVTPDPKKHALEMRTVAQKNPDSNVSSNEAHIQEHLVWALLFFAGHELGHISKQHPQASLTTIFSTTDTLQENVELAVVRMCRHAEEFWNEGNGLGGYEWIKDRSSNIRKIEQKYRQLSVKYDNADEWYKQEKAADDFAVKVLLMYLDNEYKVDNYSGIRTQYRVKAKLQRP